MESFFFDTSDSLLRIVVSVPILYCAIIASIQFSGKRTSSKMNSFDWIVTVALGSLLSSGIMLKDVYLVEVLLAVGMLVALQHLLTKLTARYRTIAKIVKSEPVLLLRDGQMLTDAMCQERIGEEEIVAAIRASGAATLGAVMAVILETDATLSVLLHDASTGEGVSTLQDVRGWSD